MIGTTLGHYQILEKLGSGGMGEVYRAHDGKLDRMVALKVLPGRLASEPQHRARFEREARAIAALKHPNIVTIHSVEEAEGKHFITMELVEGTTLTELIPEEGMSLTGFMAVALPLTRAVAEAHRHGIVHRDLKPENVMLGEGGELKILDFGLAKLKASVNDKSKEDQTQPQPLTQDGMIVGTAAYMSPEQAEARAVDARSDVFSLAVILFQMATGCRPFEGDSEVSVLLAVLRDTPPNISDLRPHLPPALSKMVRRCLDKDPAKRPASAVEVLGELEKLGSSASGELSAGRLLRRRRGLLAGLAAVLLVAVVGLSVVLRGRGPSQSEDTPELAIAVLPFLNLSGEEDSRYFSDGITEEITSKLARIGGLRVASRSAAARFHSTSRDPGDIGRELGVQFLLEGSVRRAGEQVRIAAQLVSTASGFQVWSEEFQGDMSDVFRLQEETALEIAQALDLQLSPGERRAVRQRHTTSSQAFDAYLRGRALLEYFDTPERLEAAQGHLERALELDPDYPLALVGLSRVEAQYYRNIDPDIRHLERADELARRALALDPELAEAHVAIAQVHGNRYEYAQAAHYCREAIAREPSNAYAWDLLSWSLAYQQPPDAQAAEEAARQAISLEASLIGAYYHLGRALLMQARYDEALDAFQQAKDLDPGFETASFGIAQVYLAEGDAVEAVRVLEELQTTAAAPVVMALKASAYAATGDSAKALDSLRDALEAGYRDGEALRANPHLASLHADPGYAELLHRHGLEP